MSYTYELNLGKRIGEGFFGDVHQGTDNVHGIVAVKVLRPLPGETPIEWAVRKDLLLEEAKNLKAAEHENVVRVHSVVRADADDRLHMVVEFCEKGSLQSEYELAPMSLSRVKSVLTDVCRGLECIHARGMVHRDIKPANILQSKKRLKIGDFGLVSNSLIFGYASAAGYSDHLAPEVYSEHLTSAQSDVWALGMTIYRLLHGHPFYRDHFDGIDIPESIKNGGFASNLPWLPNIPNAWRKFIRKSMHDDTSHRFKTAFAMCQSAASLPIEPDWKCRYSRNSIIWTRQRESREIEVIREILSPRKHLWRATSIGGVRSRRLAGVEEPVSRSDATAGLENFFSSST